MGPFYQSLLSRRFLSAMRIVRFSDGKKVKVGALHPTNNNCIIDFQKVCPKANFTIIGFLKKFNEELKLKIENAYTDERCFIDSSNVRIMAPAQKYVRIIGLGANYPLKDPKAATPKPFYFEKSTSSIQNPNDCILLNPNSTKSDYEGELVLVIGKECFNLTNENALDAIAGFTICNDVTEKGYIAENDGNRMFGKSIPTYLPIGPYMLMNEGQDFENFEIKTYLNGNLVQQDKVSNMILKAKEFLVHLTRYSSLKPGDLILTGTPDGCGSSFNPSRFLKPGDVIEVEISEIGRLTNPVDLLK